MWTVSIPLSDGLSLGHSAICRTNCLKSITSATLHHFIEPASFNARISRYYDFIAPSFRAGRRYFPAGGRVSAASTIRRSTFRHRTPSMSAAVGSAARRRAEESDVNRRRPDSATLAPRTA